MTEPLLRRSIGSSTSGLGVDVHCAVCSVYTASKVLRCFGPWCQRLASYSSGWLELDEAPPRYTDEQLLAGEHLEGAFAETGVLRREPSLQRKALERARGLVRNHPVVLLGHCGQGKSSVCNHLRRHEPPLAEVGRIECTTAGAKDFDMDTWHGWHVEDQSGPSIFLVDTEGWTYQRSAEIFRSYETLLERKGLARGHNPYVVLLVMSAGFMREVDKDKEHMAKAFRKFRDSDHPVIVIPVLTFSDTLASSEEKVEVSLKANQIAKAAFDGLKASVWRPHVVSSRRRGEQPAELEDEEFGLEGDNLEEVEEEGIAQLREAIKQAVSENLSSDSFREQWKVAMAEDLAEQCREYHRKHPDQESEWCLFRCAATAVAQSCGKKLSGKGKFQGSPPWHLVPHMPRSQPPALRARLAYWWLRHNAVLLMLLPWLVVGYSIMQLRWEVAGLTSEVEQLSPAGATLPPATTPLVLAGVVSLWGGRLDSIPAGWALCDGTRGTPDLQAQQTRATKIGATASGGEVYFGICGPSDGELFCQFRRTEDQPWEDFKAPARFVGDSFEKRWGVWQCDAWGTGGADSLYEIRLLMSRVSHISRVDLAVSHGPPACDDTLPYIMLVDTGAA